MMPKFIRLTEEPTGSCVRIAVKHLESYHEGQPDLTTLVRLLSTCVYEVNAPGNKKVWVEE